MSLACGHDALRLVATGLKRGSCSQDETFSQTWLSWLFWRKTRLEFSAPGLYETAECCRGLSTYQYYVSIFLIQI